MIESLLLQLLLALPLIMGAYITIVLMKLPDLSIESAYLFGAVFAVACRHLEISPLFMSFLGGSFVGLATGLFYQVCKIPILLAAIVSIGLFHGFSLYVLGSPLVSFHANTFFNSELIELSFLGIIFIASLAYLLTSQFGYTLAIFGNNPTFLTRYGISSHYLVILGLVIGDGLAGVSGYLFSRSNGFVDITMGQGIILLCITSLILGKNLISSTRPTVLVPLVGLIVYFIVQQTIVIAGVDLTYFNSMQACIVLASFLLIDRQTQQQGEALGL